MPKHIHSTVLIWKDTHKCWQCANLILIGNHGNSYPGNSLKKMIAFPWHVWDMTFKRMGWEITSFHTQGA